MEFVTNWEGLKKLEIKELRVQNCEFRIRSSELRYQSYDAKDGLSYDQWEQEVPNVINNSPLWDSVFYRKALYLYDQTWDDCRVLMKDVRGKAVASQLIRSVGSISANIEEGYSRGFGKDYARFLRIALGEDRESQGWYYRVRHLLPKESITDRMELLDEIIRLLVSVIKTQQSPVR